MRFHIKVLFIFGLLFAAAMTSILAFTIQLQRNLLNEVTSDIETVMRVVHFSTAQLSSGKPYDREALDRFILEASRHRAISEISVVGRNLEVVASSNPSKIGRKQQELLKEAMVKEKMESSDSISHYELTVPIMREQQVIGQVQATILMNNYSDLITDFNEKIFVLAILAFLLLLFLSYAVLNRMNRPLKALSEAAQKVAAGNYSGIPVVSGSDEFARVTESFNMMTNKLLEQKKLEERLHLLERRAILAETAALLAHEIRNPLNLINLTAGYLAKNYAPLEETKRQQYNSHFANLEAQVAQLNNMVNEFLAIGKPIKIEKQHFQAARLTDQIETLVKHQLIPKELQFVQEVPEELEMVADKEQMRLVLLNLVLNAVEVSPVGGTITLSVSAGTSLKIRVTDTGSGIEESNLEKVFEPYFSKRPGGTGLGLALARRIVEEHNGTICASNRQNSPGACFEISLPQEVSNG